MGLESLTIKLSGGAANADPTLSTGGAKSSTSVLSQTAVLSSSLPGVVMGNAAGNAVGLGTLAYVAAGKTITWTPPGEVIPGTPVSIGADGVYLIRGNGASAGHVLITVTLSALSDTTDYSRTVTIADLVGLMLPTVNKAVALAGGTQYFLYYLDNTGAATVKVSGIRILTDATGPDALTISKLAAKNTTEIQADAAGHTYSAINVDVALGDLATTDYWGFWIKRVVPVGLADDPVITDAFSLRVTALT